MGKKITENRWFYIVVSFLLAFVLWIYVGKEANPPVTNDLRGVQVVFSGLEKLEERGLMISQGADQTVTLRIKARREVWNRLNQGDTTVTVDVSSITEPGEQNLAVTIQRISYPRSITSTDSIDLLYASPGTISFTVSRWASKEVEVHGVFDGSVADGYQREDFSFAPEKVTVSGPEELVDQVAYAQVTVSEEDMSQTYSVDSPYTLVDFDGQPVSAEELTVDPETVLVTLPVVKLKEVELTVNLIPGGGATGENAKVDIQPSTIMVSGSEEDLEGLTSISLGDIRLDQIFGSYTQQMPIQLDPALENVSGLTEVTVTVTIEGLTTRTMKVDNIELINAPSGYTPEAITKSCSVLIRGPEDAVNAVTDSQLRIVADLSDTEPSAGNRTVPVKVYLDGSSEVGVVGSYNIVVSLS